MLKTLQLTNFRKHRTLELNFTGGLQIIRGDSEAGKTSLSEAIIYALFGAKGLREPLANVVTYDEPEGSLKVRLLLDFDGVEYSVIRGKSGAEVVYGDQRVTGQTETRTFFERLFGCSADMAKALIIADQNEVRGVLAEGGTAASSLVEKLADLGVIEKLVEGVQNQLPSGNVKSMLDQITRLTETASKVPTEPVDTVTPPLTAEIFELQAKIDLAERAVPADQEVAKARVAVEAVKRSEADLVAFRARKAKIVTELAVVIEKPAVDEDGLAQLRLEAANEAAQAERRAAYATAFPKAPAEWDGTRATLDAHVESLKETIVQAQAQIADWRVAKNTAQMKRINEKECAFCKKDLTDVPEVLAANVAADEAVQKAEEQLAYFNGKLIHAQGELKLCQSLQKHCDDVRKLAGTHWALSDTVPPVPTWKGEPPSAPGTMPDVAKLEKAIRLWRSEIAKHQMLQEELDAMVEPAVPDASADLRLLEAYEEAKAKLQSLQSYMQSLLGKLETAEQVHAANLNAYKREVLALEAVKQELEKSKQTYDEMLENNELIKKLRDARPKIATQLWGTVLGAVSYYFTQIRGEESIVERSEDGFKVNGRTVKGLSGSTQDILGLAIRIALSKVFLPVVPFVFVDEPFAGCSDNREVNGLGTLASAGFSQTFLVTHSSLGDSLADNLLQI